MTALPLSARERQVLGHASRGLTDKETARALGVSRNTLNTYWARIRGKLGSAPRAKLAADFARGDLAPEIAEVRDALAALRKRYADDCQTPESLRFRLAVDALLGASNPTAPEGA